MKIKELDIDLLKPAIYNPRKIDPEQLNDLVRSLKQFGFVDPLVVRSEDNMIIGGHQRYEAAKLLKYKTVPVVQLDISENDAKVLNVALNKISGEWEEDKLVFQNDFERQKIEFEQEWDEDKVEYQAALNTNIKIFCKDNFLPFN